ncbi:MAG: LapA family protein [Candidatus Bathyarchaeia archaeon]
MKPIIKKSAIVLALVIGFLATFLASIYVSITINREISRSNTILYYRIADLEQRGIEARKSIYVEGSVVSLWDYWDLVNRLRMKNIKDVYYSESYYVFPVTIVHAKIWFVDGQTTYVLTID